MTFFPEWMDSRTRNPGFRKLNSVHRKEMILFLLIVSFLGDNNRWALEANLNDLRLKNKPLEKRRNSSTTNSMLNTKSDQTF